VRGSSEPRALAVPQSGGFIKLGRTPLVGAFPQGEGERSLLVEVVATNGARLTLRLPAGSALDVAGLVTAFRGSLT
jgi:hypothetical protein